MVMAPAHAGGRMGGWKTTPPTHAPLRDANLGDPATGIP